MIAVALAEGYLSARGEQMEKKGGRSDTRGSRNEAKSALQIQLFKNLLFFAGESMDPEKCGFFFNQSLLDDGTAGTEPAASVV